MNICLHSPPFVAPVAMTKPSGVARYSLERLEFISTASILYEDQFDIEIDILMAMQHKGQFHLTCSTTNPFVLTVLDCKTQTTHRYNASNRTFVLLEA